MPLPLIGDYTDAVQNPAVCFNDPDLAELAAGEVERHPQNLRPLVYSGNFAAVYPMVCGGAKYALRCFTREVNDPEKRRERYQRLSNFFNLINSGAFVDYRYYEQGIRIKGEWHPVIRMEWVEGSRLDRFVEDNLSRPNRIREVGNQLVNVSHDMKTLFIAHNDLQHGNLMVQPNGSIRLVDYDGFFLPLFQGQLSPELGHAQYQHPLRKVDDYGAYVDNFPALVLYLSLMALSVDPGLWQSFYTQDNLIFTKADYADPANSRCFRALKASPDGSVRYLAGFLERCCSMPVDQIPDLEEILRDAPDLAAAAPSAPTPATPPTGAGSDYRSLLQMGQVVPAPPTIAPAAPAAPPSVLCPQCNLANPDELIYCDYERCAAVLHPGSRFCAYCGEDIPVKANFCSECGEKIA